MTYVIEPHISSYIDQAIERQRVIFSAEMKHERELIFEKFQSDVKTMGETVDLKIRETTREIIREEVTPRFEVLETKMDMVIGEIGSINEKIGSTNGKIVNIEGKIGNMSGEIEGINRKIVNIEGNIQGINGKVINIENNIGNINEKIESIETEMRSYRKDTDDFKEEMRALRKDTNRHNIRLTRLERALA